jgi:hypothetical protein
MEMLSSLVALVQGELVLGDALGGVEGSDLVRALERARHAVSHHFLATVRATKSMWV